MVARHQNLRLSVTDRCNLRCAYCLPADGSAGSSSEGLLALDDVVEIVEWLHSVEPMERIKLTGGEPLVRAGLEILVERLARLSGGPEISMTSNGILLPGLADRLKAAGLSRVNVSLDSLDPNKYREVSRGGNVRLALAGILAAKQCGLGPIKLNSVLRRSSWQSDVPALLDFAAENDLTLRFIELMRTGTEEAWCAAERVSADVVLAWLGARPDCTLMHGHGLSEYGAEPARRGRLMWRGREIEVGWILPVSRPFCSSCDRLRLDARGRLRRCLMDPIALPLAGRVQPPGRVALRRELEEFLAGKQPPSGMDHELPMAALGG